MKQLSSVLLLPLILTLCAQGADQSEALQSATKSWHLFGRVIDYSNVPAQKQLNQNDPFEVAEKLSAFKPINFTKWKKFQDEYISFKYPDHPLVKVTTSKDLSDPVLSKKLMLRNISQRRYQITIESSSSMSIEFVQTEGFRSTSSTRQMEHIHLKTVDNSLARYSFLPGGILRELQISNDSAVASTKIRKLLQPIPNRLDQLSKEEIASSIRLTVKAKDQVKSPDKWKKTIEERLGWQGLTRFVYRGMPYNEVVDLLGKPSLDAFDSKTWLSQNSDYPIRLKIRFDPNKRVESLPEYGVVIDYQNPIKGSLAWVSSLIDHENYQKSLPTLREFGATIEAETSPSDEGSYLAPEIEPIIAKIPMTPALKTEIINTVLEKLKTAKLQEQFDAVSACNLIIKKWQLDPQPYANIIAARKFSNTYALRFLSKVNHPSLEKLLLEKLIQLQKKSWTEEFT